MPRRSYGAEALEIERLQLLQNQRKSLKRRLTLPPAVKKSGFLPGDENALKDLAIFMKLGSPRISYTQIAAQIGETKTTVRKWFQEDPYVRERYLFFTQELKQGALELLTTYQMEAVLTLVSLMRFGSERYMFEAANSLLDRGGVAKVSKQEHEIENTRKYRWDDQDALAEEMRKLPPDKQEEFATAIEKLEGLLLEAAEAADKKKNPVERASEAPELEEGDGTP